MELKTTQNLNIYRYNYQTGTTIFVATKHKKAIMACSYLNFLKTFLSFWNFGHQYYKNESIHQNSWHHSHKKQIDSLETQVVFVDIFAWTWNIWGRRKVNTSKQQKMVAFVKLFSENCFEAVLVNFCCYGLWCQCFRRLAQGYCWSSYANSLKQLAVYCLLIGDTSQVSVFFLTNKNE